MWSTASEPGLKGKKQEWRRGEISRSARSPSVWVSLMKIKIILMKKKQIQQQRRWSLKFLNATKTARILIPRLLDALPSSRFQLFLGRGGGGWVNASDLSYQSPPPPMHKLLFDGCLNETFLFWFVFPTHYSKIFFHGKVQKVHLLPVFSSFLITHKLNKILFGRTLHRFL